MSGRTRPGDRGGSRPLARRLPSRLGGDPSALVCGGENRIGRFPYEAITKVCGPSGHDGQFYYALSRFPWQKHGDDLDAPALRHVRILYPAICWALSAGDRKSVV